MSRSEGQSGFALAAAVFALVVLGVLATGGFYVARQETRIGVAAERATDAFYLAEQGALHTLSEWDGTRFTSMALWSSGDINGTTADGSWTGAVTRLSRELYFIQATGRAVAGEAVYGEAKRTVGIVVKALSPNIDPKAALTTIGDLTIGGSGFVDGNDWAPTALDGYCGAPGEPKPGILIDDLSNITQEGRNVDVEGDPPMDQDPTLTPDSLLNFGAENGWEDLVKLADAVFPHGSHVTQTYTDSVLLGGSYVCQRSNPRNWGNPHDPESACGRYFPVIYAAGDFRIDSSDFGQGILLVEGDLAILGGFEFFGPVIVKGTLFTEGTGSHFYGGLIAANAEFGASSAKGNATVQYSSCAVERAVLGSGLTRAVALERRSFVDLSSVTGG